MEFLKLNLLPVEYRVKRKELTWILDRRFIWPVILTIVVLFIEVFMYYGTYESKQELERQLVDVNAKIESKKPIITKIRTMEKQLKEIEQKNLALQSIQVSKKRWIVIYENLSSVITPNTWFTKFAQNIKAKEQTASKFDPNQMTLTGQTHQFSEVAEYMVDLENFDSIDDVKLLGIKTVKVKNESVFEYNVLIKFNPYIGLDLPKKEQTVTLGAAK